MRGVLKPQMRDWYCGLRAVRLKELTKLVREALGQTGVGPTSWGRCLTLQVV